MKICRRKRTLKLIRHSMKCPNYLQLAWIRHRDVHILTVGSYTYTTDQRFHVTYNKEKGESILEIKWASIRDAGLYECQISSEPIRSLFVNLDVVGECEQFMGFFPL